MGRGRIGLAPSSSGALASAVRRFVERVVGPGLNS